MRKPQQFRYGLSCRAGAGRLYRLCWSFRRCGKFCTHGPNRAESARGYQFRLGTVGSAMTSPPRAEPQTRGPTETTAKWCDHPYSTYARRWSLSCSQPVAPCLTREVTRSPFQRQRIPGQQLRQTAAGCGHMPHQPYLRLPTRRLPMRVLSVNPLRMAWPFNRSEFCLSMCNVLPPPTRVPNRQASRGHTLTTWTIQPTPSALRPNCPSNNWWRKCRCEILRCKPRRQPGALPPNAIRRLFRSMIRCLLA